MTRGSEPLAGSGSPHFCNHANEVPTGMLCDCPPWCYCATRTCASRRPTPPAGLLHVRLRPSGDVIAVSGVTDEEFDAHVAATELTEDGRRGGLDYCLLKLAAEAGETGAIRAKEILAGDKTPEDAIAKRTLQQQLARRAAYALELGDVLWYLHEACRLLGVTVDQVKRLNVMKLQRRREPFLNTGRERGKDPAGEQREAEALLLRETPTPALDPSPPEEFLACVFCGQWTRHRRITQAPNAPPGLDEHPVCKALACRQAAIVEVR